MARVVVLAVVASMAAAGTVGAQPKAPIGRFVVDFRGATAGLPTSEGWTPLVPAGTIVPSRGFGLDMGAHVRVARLRGATFGVGAAWLLARGVTAPATPASMSTAAIASPEVTTRVSSVAPQVSMAFGHSTGWSYLSAGLGRANIESRAVAASSTLQYLPRESGWTKVLNFGGGARWFVNDHLGVGFDLRWHKLSIVPASATHPGAPRATLVALGAGISIK